jgi:hypothetical protein
MVSVRTLISDGYRVCGPEMSMSLSLDPQDCEQKHVIPTRWDLLLSSW